MFHLYPGPAGSDCPTDPAKPDMFNKIQPDSNNIKLQRQYVAKEWKPEIKDWTTVFT